MDNAARLVFRRGFTAAGSPSTASTVSSSTLIASPTGGAQISMLPSTLGLVGQTNQFRGDLARIGPRFDGADGGAPSGLVSTAAALVGSGRRIILRAVQASATFQIGGNTTLAAPNYIARGLALDENTTPAEVLGYFGFVDSGNTASGQIGKVPDFAYTPGTWVSQFDWYYVVEEGPALVTIGAPINLGQAIMFDGTGRAIPYVAAATNHNAGTLISIASAATTATLGTNALAWINPGLRIG